MLSKLRCYLVRVLRGESCPLSLPLSAVCLFVCFTVFQWSVVDIAFPRMEPARPEGRQTCSSSCAGNRPLPLQGARRMCCFGALAGCLFVGLFVCLFVLATIGMPQWTRLLQDGLSRYTRVMTEEAQCRITNTVVLSTILTQQNPPQGGWHLHAKDQAENRRMTRRRRPL